MQTAQMLILPLIPIGLLIGQNLVSLIETFNYQTSVADVDRQVSLVWGNSNDLRTQNQAALVVKVEFWGEICP